MRRSTVGWLALTLGLSLLVGCGVSVGYVPLTTTPYPPTDRVEMVGGDVTYPYDSLGIITGSRKRWNSPGELLEAMKARAQAAGATAIIRLDTFSYPGMVLSSGVIVNRSGLKGLAIRRNDAVEPAAVTPTEARP